MADSQQQHHPETDGGEMFCVSKKDFFAEQRQIYLFQMQALNERLTSAKRSAIAAWVLVFVAIVTTAIIAVMLTKNVKEVPFLVIRDGEGRFQYVRVDSGRRTYDQGVNLRAIQDYLACREGYVRITYITDMETCFAMTSKDGYEQLMEYYGHSDPKKYPNNNYARFGEKGSARVSGITIQYLEQQVALVRYTVKESREGEEDKIFRWIAKIEFRFDRGEVSEKNFRANPLGFIVTKFERATDGTEAK